MPSKKNILIVASSLHIGGAERVIANLAKHLDRDRFHVTVCHLLERGVIGDELQQFGVHIVGNHRHEDPIRRYLSFLGLRKIIQDNNIDLLHSHTVYSLCDSSLCRLTTLGIKTVHTFHRGNYPSYDRRYMRMEKLFSKACDQLVAVGVEQANKICTAYNIPRQKLLTVLNGVEDAQSSGDPDWKERFRKDGRMVIGSISTLIEQKGLSYLLDTAHALLKAGANVLFVVVGEGELRPQLEEKCRQLGITDSVIFTGWIPNAANRMMPLFDIFFQSSLWEAMSMVVLEAMALGRPVVVTDVGDNRHVIEHGHSGLVVPAADVAQMVTALQLLLNSEVHRRQFGERARARFEMEYTARVMAQKYEMIYSELLE